MARSAIFVGDGSLLVECAGLFLERGGNIAAVLTGNDRVRDWATAAGLQLGGSAVEPHLGAIRADFLFSVANLVVLPGTVLETAGQAINFHDGPLPGYAGLNATSWAIMAGETRHAVTWHEMTARVDAGRILAEEAFGIDTGETAFSLNAKCYSAGLSAFGKLLDGLFAGGIEGRGQSGENGWFGRDKRPENMGYLDFSQPAAVLSRLVRALDFGQYANTLTTAKLWTGNQTLVVRDLAIGQAPAAAPGAVLEASADSVTVAVRDGTVVLRQLETLDGMAVSAAFLKAGSILPPVPEAALQDAAKAAVRADGHWLATLPALKGAPVPAAQVLAVPGQTALECAVAVPGGMSPDQAMAGFALWLGLCGSETGFALGVPAVAGQSLLARAETVVVVTLDPAETAGDFARRFADARANALPMTADLLARLPAGTARVSAADAISVAVAAGPGMAAGQFLGGRRLVLGIDAGQARLAGSGALFDAAGLDRLASQFGEFLAALSASGDARLDALPLAAAADFAGPKAEVAASGSIHAEFSRQAAQTPDAPALEADGETLSFAELDRRSSLLAGALAERGAKAGAVVGLCLERSCELVVAMLAILKTGAAYLPMDPAYPAERIAFMTADSGAPLIVARSGTAARLGLDAAKVIAPDARTAPLQGKSGAELAYLIYTSGSTGTPKGVMVSHANVLNFMAGMDLAVPHQPGDRLLAVTSVSFDISVLEIFWTLTRGMVLVLQTDGTGGGKSPDFSLFYFASEAAASGPHAYRLLLEGAKFADDNGFKAIWTPERHFHAFGGLFPNPAIVSAMLAGITRNVQIRAGSIVLPLHHPVRAAEDWSLVDNLSGGRAGMAIASGWQPNDFILQPQNFDRRKDVMLEHIQTLRSLWKGEAVEFPNHKGEMVKTSILPKPVQKEIPLWITAAGNPETFAAAARIGCGVLTHLLGQTFDEVAEKIRAYRVAWAEAGHQGTGTVTLMLHTFIADDEAMVLETVRGPMRSYLKSAVDLIKRASWTFPTFVQKGESTGMTPQQVFEGGELSAEETDALLDHAFNRYYRESGLFGTPEGCVEIVRKVAAIGVDEIACLIDFGVDTDLALQHLDFIKDLMALVKAQGGAGRKASVAEHIAEMNIGHLQCTPSTASLLLADEAGRKALGRLQVMLVGGEALPPETARGLRAALPGSLLNMYGPTETTVWSSVARLDEIGAAVPLGAPIANTGLSVRNAHGQALPDGMPGELWISGEGVSLGYWQRPELTADRFVSRDGRRHYRTGDLVRRKGDVLEFLGRMDNQVKIRGHRIELGEIEARLAAQPSVRQAAAVAEGSGDSGRLVGYVTLKPGFRAATDELRAVLATALPEFMQLSAVVVLDHFPMTPNGKIDRKALRPAPSAAQAEPKATMGETEAAIADIWREALGLETVGVTDNFFDLGGHSLLVVQVQRRLKAKFGKEIPIVDMFRFSTISGLAGLVAGDKDDSGDSAAKRGQERALARRSRMARRTGD